MLKQPLIRFLKGKYAIYAKKISKNNNKIIGVI
jgi:hypothetical protein